MTTLAHHPVQYVDIWSRTARKYRIRAVVMLLLLFLLFAGLCCFMFWLRTGEAAPWQYQRYGELVWQSFLPTGTDQITLSHFLTRPIPVQEVPVQAVIMGLLFASLCSVPILVTILYRLPFAVPFAAMVFGLAAMPWFGITVLIGCVLAAMGNARMSFRYASALLGLIPMAIYFIAASLEPFGVTAGMAESQALLFAPWVLALLSSCVICALSLAVAKLINYRPGGMPPVLAVLFAMPLLLFQAYVGRDELEFRILEGEYGRSSASVFAQVDIGALALEAAKLRCPDDSGAEFAKIYGEIYDSALSNILEGVEQKRFDAVARCDAFLERFPRSRHVPDVLFLKARSLDYRIHRRKLEIEHRVEFRSDMPGPASRRVWLTLADQFPAYSGTLAAHHRLAWLDAADGAIDRAIGRLDALIRRIEAPPMALQDSGDNAGFVEATFLRSRPAQSVQVNAATILALSKRLREKLLACQGDEPLPYHEVFGDREINGDELLLPVRILLWLDEAHPRYRENLEQLLRHFPESEAAGYASVRIALLEDDMSRRIERLRELSRVLAERQAGAEAMYLLADALHEFNRIEEAEHVFESLMTAHPGSFRAEEARKRRDALMILRRELAETENVARAD